MGNAGGVRGPAIAAGQHYVVPDVKEELGGSCIGEGQYCGLDLPLTPFGGNGCYANSQGQVRGSVTHGNACGRGKMDSTAMTAAAGLASFRLETQITTNAAPLI